MAEEGIVELKARRLRRWDAFLKKGLANPRFAASWFPPREVRTGLRRLRRIVESRSSTWRRFNSQLEALRRQANELGLTAIGGTIAAPAQDEAAVAVNVG